MISLTCYQTITSCSTFKCLKCLKMLMYLASIPRTVRRRLPPSGRRIDCSFLGDRGDRVDLVDRRDVYTEHPNINQGTDKCIQNSLCSIFSLKYPKNHNRLVFSYETPSSENRRSNRIYIKSNIGSQRGLLFGSKWASNQGDRHQHARQHD